MNSVSGWLRRKPAGALRVLRATQEEPTGEDGDNAMRDRESDGEHARRSAHENADDGDDDNDGDDDDDDGANNPVQLHELLVGRRRNRVNYMASDSSSSSDDDDDDDTQHDGNDDVEADDDDGGDQVGDDPLDRLLRDDDSAAGSVRGDDDADQEDANGADDANAANALRVELGLDDDDDDEDVQWDEIAQQHPDLFMVQRPPLPHHLHRRRVPEIAMHFAPGGANGRANDRAHGRGGVDLQAAQADDAQEIDLTALPSDDDDDDDDDVEIVGTTVPLLPMPIRPIGDVRLVPGRTPNPTQSRKRRRTSTGDAAAAPQPFDTQRAESTNISLENNDTIERFKAALKCSVCLEVIEEMTSTICGHVYCAKCIRLAIRVTHKCPLCQRPLRPTDIHGLYF